MELKKAFKNQYFFSVIAKMFMVIIGLLNSIFLARYLGPELKGIVTSVVNNSNIISIVITFGLHQAYFYYRKRDQSEGFLSEFMSLTIVVFSIYFLVSGCIIAVILPDPEVISCAMLSIIMGYSTVVNHVALAEFPNRRNTIMSLIHLIDLLVLIFLYFVIPVSYGIAMVLSGFVFLAEAIIYTWVIPFKFNIHNLRVALFLKYIKFGLLPMLAILLSTFNYRIDVIMLRASDNVSFAEIGIYSIGVSLAEKVFLVPDAVKEILISKLTKGKDKEEVAKVIRVCWPIALLSTIGIVIFGKLFIDIFYGIEYSAAYQTTVICVFGTVFMVFFKMISSFNIVNGKQYVNMIVLVIADLFNVVLNLCLIPIWGCNGAAIASDISYLLCALAFLIYFSKTQSIPIKKIVLLQKNDLKVIRKKKRG